MGPLQKLSVDIVSPLPTTPCRFKLLLVVIDRFTKFIELFSLRSVTSKTIVNCVLGVFRRHGVPMAISSNNGKPFVSGLWKGLLQHWKITDRHMVPHRPAGQLLERYNGTVKESLGAYCTDHRNWD